MKALSILSLCLVAVGHANSSPRVDEPGKQAFERMKSLVGKWAGKMEDSGETMDSEIEYRLTGGGSALVETMGAGTPYEMISVYHMDGSSLVMTHYCGAGNQPFLKFKPGKEANSIFFDFVSGSNMKPNDMHMHSVRFTFSGADHVVSEWQSYMNGKPGATAKFDMHRVK